MLEAYRVVLYAAIVLVAAPVRADPEVPAPYSAPFQLRPAAAASAFRSDTAFAFHDSGGTTIVSTLAASYKLDSTLAPFLRVAVIDDQPAMGGDMTGISNPAVGVTWAPKLSAPFKLGVLGAMTAPIGGGGGNTPDMARVLANKDAIMARSAMDNALFAPNDLALITGVSAAYVDGGLTVQAEATVFELIRVRGSDVQPDKTKTNLTSGLYAGYFLIKQVSIGGELRYQRYLSTPSFVTADPTSSIRDTMSAAVGVRTHWKLDAKQWLRPGVSYTRGLDDPMKGRSFNILQVDLLYAY